MLSLALTQARSDYERAQKAAAEAVSNLRRAGQALDKAHSEHTEYLKSIGR